MKKQRKCPYCKKEKNYKSFRLVKSKLPRRGWIDIDGNQRWFQCKICEPLYKAKHYNKTDISRKILWHLKDRCRKRNIKCELSYEDVKKMIDETKGICPCCNKKFDRNTSFMENGVKRLWLTHSLDRIDNSERNYTVKNTRVMCLRCNLVKSAWSIQDFKNVIKFMEKYK
tara:strand:+ start:682 stop:1191 length:510 start_codon:yes stop_codon:yes gene_type:complete